MCPIKCHTHQQVDREVVALNGPQKIELADEVEVIEIADFCASLQFLVVSPRLT